MKHILWFIGLVAFVPVLSYGQAPAAAVATPAAPPEAEVGVVPLEATPHEQQADEDDGLMVEVVTRITYIFFLYLLLALFVERGVEILMAVFKYTELKRKWRSAWNKKAEKVRVRLERVYGFQGEGTERAKGILDWVYWQVLTEKPHPGGRRIVSADLIRLYYLRVGSRVAGFLLSLLLVFVIWEQRNDFNLIQQVAEFYDLTFPGASFVSVIAEQKALSQFISAVAISIGTEPLHNLIARIEKLDKKEKATSGGAQ